MGLWAFMAINLIDEGIEYRLPVPKICAFKTSQVTCQFSKSCHQLNTLHHNAQDRHVSQEHQRSLDAVCDSES